MIESMKSYFTAIKKDRICAIGWLFVFIGGGLLIYSYSIPLDFSYENLDNWLLSLSTQFVGSIFLIVGAAGVLHKKINKSVLKTLDLIWVTGAAVGVFFGMLMVVHNGAEAQRLALRDNIADSLNNLRTLVPQEYQMGCQNGLSLGEKRCRGLLELGRTLSNGSKYLSLHEVDGLCPNRLVPNVYPKNFPPGLITLCMNARYVTNASNDRLLFSTQDMFWMAYRNVWQLLLFILVGIRLTKSVAEVFWNKPELETNSSLETRNPYRKAKNLIGK